MDPADAVVQACRSLAGSGLVRGTSGNVSVRTGSLMAVSPTGVAYHQLGAEDVSLVGVEDGIRVGGLEPSSELQLHQAIYQHRPDVRAVVHTHSMFATVYASTGQPIPPVHYLLARAGGTPPIAGYARYGTSELAENCRRALGAGSAVLLANHGVVTVGSTLAQALAAAEAIEYVAELAWRSRQVGEPRLLSVEQLAEAAAAFDHYGQSDRDPG